MPMHLEGVFKFAVVGERGGKARLQGLEDLGEIAVVGGGEAYRHLVAGDAAVGGEVGGLKGECAAGEARLGDEVGNLGREGLPGMGIGHGLQVQLPPNCGMIGKHGLAAIAAEGEVGVEGLEVRGHGWMNEGAGRRGWRFADRRPATCITAGGPP